MLYALYKLCISTINSDEPEQGLYCRFFLLFDSFSLVVEKSKEVERISSLD